MFSTAVYALGTNTNGRMTALHTLARVGEVASFATVVLWAATTLLYLGVIVRDVARGFVVEYPP